jgi:hypothetical protein
MGAKLNPFVPALMEHLFIALNPTYPFLIKELALNAIGATGNHILFLPFCYFQFFNIFIILQ